MHPVRIDPLLVELATALGHRLVALSLEVYDTVADLRFARIDVEGCHALARRVPARDAWQLRVDGRPVEVVDAVGRGDRSFSNGEVRFTPPPPPGASLDVTVRLGRDTDPATTTIVLPREVA